MSKFTWNEANTAQLTDFVGTGPVSQETVAAAAEELGTSPRSVGAKLRKLGFEVDKATGKTSAWSAEQEAALVDLLNSNEPGAMTYAELAAVFEAGAFNAKQLQGKVLSLELTHLIRKADKKEIPREYSDEETASFVAAVAAGSSIETLATKFGRTASSVRGKALSLLRSGDISEMPKQEVSNAKERTDVLQGLDVAEMTVAEIAEATGKSERGIKSMLSRRGIACKDHDGASRREKLDASKE